MIRMSGILAFLPRFDRVCDLLFLLQPQPPKQQQKGGAKGGKQPAKKAAKPAGSGGKAKKKVRAESE